MNKAYNRTYWENYPSDETPVNKRNLNNIEVGVDEIDNRVITLDTTKADKTTVATMVKDVSYDESTGIFTVKYLNGATYFLDTKLEKLAVNFSYDASAQRLNITLDDGNVQQVDLSALITEYEFLNTDTVAFSIDTAGKVSALVKDGSITEDKLRPNYLADIKLEVSKAQASEKAAATSANNAAGSAKEAESFAHGGTGERENEDTDNAKYYSDLAKTYYDDLSQSGTVTGVKGAAEAEYRNGNVTISKEDIGLGYVDNTADKDKRVSYADSAGSAETATKATQDGNGNVISSTYAKEIPSNTELVTSISPSFDGADSYETLQNTKGYLTKVSDMLKILSGKVNILNKNKLDKSGGTFTGDLIGGSGGRLGPDGNVYMKCHGYTDYLSNILNGKLSTSASCNKNWNWIGQTGQPDWVWGGKGGDGNAGNYYVWSPAQFQVARAHRVGRTEDGDVGVGMYLDGSWSFGPLSLSQNVLSDAFVELGRANGRWRSLYASSSTIITSDRNYKENIQPLTEQHLKFFLLLQPVSFTFKDGTSDRTHVGFISQDVEFAMKEVGLTELDFAGFCKDIKRTYSTDENGEMISEPVLDDDGNPEYIYSLRYEEFIAINTYAIQRLYQRVDALETALEEINSKLNALVN